MKHVEKNVRATYLCQSSSTLGLHCRCVPGTDNDVIIIVTHRRRNTVPDNAKNRLSKINLEKEKLHNFDKYSGNRNLYFTKTMQQFQIMQLTYVCEKLILPTIQSAAVFHLIHTC